MLVIPEKLKKILEKDLKLFVEVTETSNDFSELLIENKCFFFEEYTNHGIGHINSLLKACSDLIHESTAKNLLKPNDVAVLILSALIHDIGMHVTLETFILILKGSYDDVRIESLDDKTWSELWQDYVSEAKKFDEETIKKIFGPDCLNVKIPNIYQPHAIDASDKKFIGEFLRRNHPRLAHEIALKGFIGPEGKIEFGKNLDFNITKIVGVTARSHGLGLRGLFDYLQVEFDLDWMFPFQIHMIYIMTLLRLGDILQIESNRIPSYIFKLHKFDSTISFEEFQKHSSIQNFAPSFSDSETLQVLCNPPNANICKCLQELFHQIQFEIDTSWAILGEIYGSKPDHDRPMLTRRRIKSNIDDIKRFSKNLNYIPEFITLDVEPNLVKLLIAPLYGDNPSYGVRELVQNAADACNERKVLEKKSFPDYIPKIEINIFKQAEHYFFEIIDNGKGMDVEEIKKFFFRVGSSFKFSEVWKRDFTTDSNKSTIPRIGKFGVGVLASFLLGESMTVQTRRYNESVGYNFEFNLRLKNVELIKAKNAQIGTQIKIKIQEKILDQLYKTSSLVKGYVDRIEYKEIGVVRYTRTNFFWDKWFTLDSPSLTISFLNQPVYKPYSPADPGFTSPIPAEWCCFECTNFEKILWTYSERFSGKKLVVNGIVIPNGYKILSNYIQSTPNLSVFDLNGNINLLLNRSGIENNILPFNDSLRLEIYKHLLSKILVTEIKTSEVVLNAAGKGKKRLFKTLTSVTDIHHPAFKGRFRVFRNSEGFIINFLPFLKKFQDYQYIANISYLTAFKNGKLLEDYFIVSSENVHEHFPYISQKEENDFFEVKTLEIDMPTKNEFKKTEAENKNTPRAGKAASEARFFDSITLGEESSQVYDLFDKLLGSNWLIPYDMAARKKKFPEAFALLAPYIANSILV